MTRIILCFKDGGTLGYSLVRDTEEFIKFEDQDGTLLKLIKNDNKLYSYDVYNKAWKYMKNTTETLDRVEII